MFFSKAKKCKKRKIVAPIFNSPFYISGPMGMFISVDFDDFDEEEARR